VQILQGEIIAADPNSNKGHLLKLNNDLYLYDKKETIIQLQCLKSLSFMVQIAFIVLILLLTKDAKQIGLF
jgi:hypothetical protein